MKKEIFLPIYLGILAKEGGHFWLAEEDTIRGHAKNMAKGSVDHEDIIVQIIERFNLHKTTGLNKARLRSFPV